MEPGSREFRRFMESMPKWLVVLTVGLPLIAGSLGWLFPVGFSLGNTQLFLSSLAGAQASVLAIVFSVTLLGIQLATTRYATRMIPLFVESTIFRYTLGVFLISIAVDFGVLYNLPSSSTRPAVSAVFFASGLAIAAAVSLVVFIPRMLQLGTPDGLIDEFEARLPSKEYLEKSRQLGSSGPRADHPIQPLHSLVMASLSRQEWATAESGLTGFENILTRTITELSDTDDIPRQMRDPVVNSMFQLPLQKFLPEITLHAFENDERELTGQAITVIGQSATTALENDRRYIARMAVRGYRRIFSDTPLTMEGSVILNNTFRELQEILKGVANRPDPEELRTILRTLDNSVNTTLGKDAEPWVYRDFLMTYFDQSLPIVQKTLLDYYEDYLQDMEDDIDWSGVRTHHDYANRELFQAFFQWRKAFLNTSSRIIEYRSRNGDYPMMYGNFFSAWKGVCRRAAASGAEEYGKIMCMLMIETAYIGSIVDEESRTTWVGRIADIKKDHNQIVDRAFRTLSKEGRTGLIHISRERLGDEEPEGWIESISASIANATHSFEDWVEAFEDDVQEDYQRLIEK